MGGWQNWEQVESIQQNGTLYRGTIETDYVMVRKRPDRMRMTLTLPATNESSAPIQIIRAFNGQEAWSAVRPVGQISMKQTPLDAESTEAIRKDASILPVLMRLSDAGTKFEDISTIGNGAGNGVYKFAARNSSGEHSYNLYVSTKTFLLERYEEIENGEIITIIEQNNFKSLPGGVKVPQTLLITNQNTNKTRMEIESTEIGVGIYNEYFEMNAPEDKSVAASTH